MQGLLTDIGEARAKLRERVRRWPGLVESDKALARVETLASAAPRVVLLGESNSGKTAVAQLLLDQTTVPDGVAAAASWPLVLRCAQATSVARIGGTEVSGASGTRDAGQRPPLQSLEVGLPNPRLALFDLVDTPGLSDPEELNALRLRANDLLIWCTPATQAWKASERQLWMSIPPRHHRHAILVVTHRDLLRDDNDVRRVRGRLVIETTGCFRSLALVCAVAADASASSGQLKDCGAAELDDRIEESLAVITQRRMAASYRLASCVVNDALTLMRHTPPLRPPDGNLPRVPIG